jgi:hypothetical protein
MLASRQFKGLGFSSKAIKEMLLKSELNWLAFGFVTKFGVRGLGSTFRNSPKSLLCIDFYFQINNKKIDNQAILVVCLLKFWARSPYV